MRDVGLVGESKYVLSTCHSQPHDKNVHISSIHLIFQMRLGRGFISSSQTGNQDSERRDLHHWLKTLHTIELKWPQALVPYTPQANYISLYFGIRETFPEYSGSLVSRSVLHVDFLLITTWISITLDSIIAGELQVTSDSLKCPLFVVGYVWNKRLMKVNAV